MKRRFLVWILFGLAVPGWIRAADRVKLGGSVRGYQFFRVEKLPLPLDRTRRDLEFGSLRLTWEAKLHPRLKWEGHAVLDFFSPDLAQAAGVATGPSNTYLPLERNFLEDPDYRLQGRLDRLNLQLDLKHVRVTLGRQAITWGVAYFWPTLDLFSPFSPERIDRDYKSGVDAVRLTFPLSTYSELQIVGAGLGKSLRSDGAAGAQLRFKLGRADLGLMAGRFQGDSSAGAFFTSDVAGTAIRGEAAWTQSGDPFEQRLGRGTFWRATLGLDRQLTPGVGLTVELSYNGFGAGNASRYLLLSQSDRVRRGSVSSLGTYYLGNALTWQVTPLWTFSNTVLLNAQDPSALWIPALTWSTSDNSTLLLAVQAGLGPEFQENLRPLSEYGPVPATAFLAFTWYF